MLETDLLGRSETQFAALGRPRLLILFSCRYDAHLVPALRENLAGLADGFVIWDDRASAEAYTDETGRRRRLLAEAQRLGADWILAMDPDERLEPAAIPALRALMDRGTPVLPVFNLREMWTPDAWRSDGLWGHKTLNRMAPLVPGVRFDFPNLHSTWRPSHPKMPLVQTGLNLYHLKMLDPARRQARRNLYASLDPERQFQALGYDYLVDEAGLTLEKIAPERMFRPAHLEDGALWMPVLDTPQPDRPENRLLLAANLLRRGLPNEADAALTGLPKLLEDWQMPPAGQGHWLLRARRPQASAAFRKALLSEPVSAGAWDGLLEALGQAGDWRARDAALAEMKVARPEGDELTRLRLMPPLGKACTTTAFAEQGWSAGGMQIDWGELAPVGAAMAVVVIGHNGPAELARAVDSVLNQTPQPLVIAVNSGNGHLPAILGERMKRLIAVSVPEPVFVGAARNIGAALTIAPWIAFLAGDCTADPGWVAARLAAHEGGAMTVSSPVLPSENAGAVERASHRYLFSTRLPWTPEKRRIDFGLSYARCLLPAHGWFDPALRVSEDSRLNEAIARFHQPVFASGAVTRHAGPVGIFAAMADIAQRRKRQSRFMPVTTRLPLAVHGAACIVQAVRRANQREARGLSVATDIDRFAPVKASKGEALALRLLRFAAFAGRLLDLPRDLRERRRARRIVTLCEIGDVTGTKRQFNPTPHLAALAALELAGALEAADLPLPAILLLENSARFTVPEPSHKDDHAALASAIARLKSSLPLPPALKQTDAKAT